jgi:hypothetical protein
MKYAYSNFEFFLQVTRALATARISASVSPAIYRDSVRDLREVRNRLFRRLGVVS